MELKWERINDPRAGYLERTRTPTGWLVCHVDDVLFETLDGRTHNGFEWRTALAFVPDPDGLWLASERERIHAKGAAIGDAPCSVGHVEQAAPVAEAPTEQQAHIKWLQECLREAGYCIDGGKCHHQCGAEGECCRMKSCAPLTGSRLRNDWALAAPATEQAKAESPMPNATVQDAMMEIDAQRARRWLERGPDRRQRQTELVPNMRQGEDRRKL